MNARLTKVDIVTSIAVLLDVETPRMSTGSTEPREIFAIVNDRLGLGIRPQATKQELARRIVEASGNLWAPDFESRGATVTLAGLIAVENAVRFFLGAPPRSDDPASRVASVREEAPSPVPARRIAAVRISDYLEPSPVRLTANWIEILERSWPTPGTRQVTFTPVEAVLCLAASLRVQHSSFGGSTSEQAPSPVPELASMFKRPPSSILAKMANLDGSRPHGGKFDATVAAELGSDLDQLADVYRRVLAVGRELGIDSVALPDFLGCEHGGVPRRPVDY